MKIFGILNLSPDSFSGDGLREISDINSKILAFKNKGVYGVDVGAQATNPDAKLLTLSEEMSVIKTYLPGIISDCKALGLAVSIDTFRVEVAEFSASIGVDYINDVSGLQNPEILQVLKKNQKLKYILMHSLGAPTNKNVNIDTDANILEILLDFASKKRDYIVNNGISKDRIIFDPGIGFGKTGEQNWEIIRNFQKLSILDLPLYIGCSRKRFLSCISDDFNQRDIAVKTIHKILEPFVHYCRTHAC